MVKFFQRMAAATGCILYALPLFGFLKRFLLKFSRFLNISFCFLREILNIVAE